MSVKLQCNYIDANAVSYLLYVLPNSVGADQTGHAAQVTPCVKCHVAAVKSPPVLHYSAIFIFVFLGIIDESLF